MNKLIMGSYTDVKNLIISNIKANGQRAITGPILQDVLLNMLENSSRVEEITYSDLKALRDDVKLIPSRLYRITDYITTTVQPNTKSAGHPFDVIVLAISESELLEQAWAIQHEGDEYFANSNLSAWELCYCLDNNTTRFAWADSVNGKGVIYRMIDEFDNDCPYDFKNIQFKDPNSPDNNYYYYTFSGYGDEETDYSIFRNTNIFSNTISPFYGNDLTNSKQTINKILFSVGGDGNCYGNYFGSGCYNITLAFYCCNNTFGNGCYSNSLDPYCSNNTFEDKCHSNILNSSCTYNIFEYNCYSNTLGEYCSNNTFGNNCYSNSFENYCEGNIFGNNCYSNTICSDSDYNIFGNGCYSNRIDIYCSNNTFGNKCYSNNFDGNCTGNNFGNNCSNNSFGSECVGNSLGADCDNITIGGMSSDNSFSGDCSYIKFAAGSSVSSAKYDLYQHNHFGVGCQYILFKETEPYDDNLYNIQNYNFAQGLQGTSDKYITIDGKRNRAYETYISKDTDGTIKESVIAEFENKLGNCVDLTSEQTITAAKIFSAGIDLNGTRISKVGSPINTDDATNKEYVDTQVKTVEDKVNDFKTAGYLYAGIATPETSIGTPETKVFYIANGKGAYTNFDGIEVTEDDVVILYYDTIWHKVATGIASNEKLAEFAHKDEVRHIERDLGMYPELEPVPLNPEVTGKYINSDGKYVDASGWNVASIGAVYLGNTYLLNMVSSANMVLGVALFVSRVYKRDKEGKIIGTVLTPLFSAKNTSIPASGYVLFEAMDDYEEVLICYKPELATQMLVARWGFKASHATQLRNLRLIVDNKTDFEGIYELLTAGYALNLVGKGNGEPQAFLSRKTGGGNITDGSAVIKEVDGVKPIVWNQLVNTDGMPTTVTKNGITITMDRNKFTLNGTSTSEVFISIGTEYPTLTKGHKYVLFGSDSNSYGVNIYANTLKWNPINVGCAISSAATETKIASTTIRFYVSPGETFNNKVVYCGFSDLTQMFGAGNEPSTYEEYLDRISHYHIEDAYAYNEGEIVNYRGTGIKTTGRNIWDEQWELGGLDATGQSVANSNRLRSKNYIPCIGGTTYYIYCGGSNSGMICFYDNNKNFISADATGVNRKKSSPINATYIKFYIYKTDIATYNYDICINLSDPAFNGQYEPYKSYVRDWSEVMKKYFPDGMTSLNGVKDFFNERRAVRKWGVVDLGSLSWYYNGDMSEGIKQFRCTDLERCAIDSKFIFIQNDSIVEITPRPDGNININYKTTSQGSDEFKTAMQGVKLYYELAEPVEDIFDKPLNLTYTVINGGTETSLSEENSTQFEGSIAYNKDYVAVVDELQMQNRVIQIEFENWEN